MNDEQISTLRSLHFWRRNEIAASKNSDEKEVEVSKLSIKELFKIADQQDITFKIQNQVLHHAETTNNYFSDIQLNHNGNEGKEMYNNLAIDEEILKHSVRVQSVSGKEISEYELAELIITNGINGKEHKFIVYGDDGIHHNDFGATYIWLNSVDDTLTLEMSREEIESTLDDNLFQSSLDEIIVYDESLLNIIQDSYNNRTEFSIDIPDHKVKFELQSIIIDEEITDMTYSAKDGILTAKDIIDFGKLVQHNTDISVGQLNYLSEPIIAVLKESPLEMEKMHYVEKTLEAFQLDKTEFKKCNLLEKDISKQQAYEKSL
jgi:hypothetical protein